ncbi:hypothetical protein [Microvirga tunisiensis]|uniref:Uncharacterized protein n=1 Tax=Microvirga tunisiensis TaxID=2108360 RepID=A0A5N7MSD6_9HYPH|nr:hypothetical protein [Microvirga tunisiensis]MPR11949.1 hypothetical protein [Microvirga tunisiensis]MPR29907.1 hypothetical protein [Microvirga tunisiensis]
MFEFLIKTVISGPAVDLAAFRSHYLELFPRIEKNEPDEIIAVLSGDRQDPRPTLLNLSGEFPTLVFLNTEYRADLGEAQASSVWILQDGEAVVDFSSGS